MATNDDHETRKQYVNARINKAFEEGFEDGYRRGWNERAERDRLHREYMKKV